MLLLFTSCEPFVTPTGFDGLVAPQGYDTSGSTRFLEAAAVCMETQRDDKEANLVAIESTVDAIVADHPETDVIVFPELCTSWLYVEADPTGYFRSVAEPIPGPSTDRVRDSAMQHQVAVVFGLAEPDGDHYHSAQALIRSDGSLVSYRKRGLNEGDLRGGCSPGEGVAESEIQGVGVTFAICSDCQDEAVIRDLSVCASPVVLASLVTATVLNPRVDFFARSIGKWVVYANGGGENSGFDMPGRVFIADPTGTVHAPGVGPGSRSGWACTGAPASRRRGSVSGTRTPTTSSGRRSCRGTGSSGRARDGSTEDHTWVRPCASGTCFRCTRASTASTAPPS
jgi:predicted amidohydrolase